MTTTFDQAPGVYRQDADPVPVPSLAVGVPVFLGLAGGGDANAPVRLTMWPQFEAAFGPATGFLGAAVRGFFENDGLVCYAVRLDEVGTAALGNGLEAAAELDADLVCAPDLAALGDPVTVVGLQRQVLDHCELAGGRLAILDGVLTSKLDDVETQRRDLTSRDGALYHPWVWVAGPGGGAPRYVPPCGHVAGSYARGDRTVGVHKAPANVPLEGVLDLRAEHTTAELARALELGINCLRPLPGRGTRAWGARTLSSDTAWRQVNGRRVFHSVSRWIERFLTGLVHEPNDVRLWVRVMRELTAYLDALHARGALRGRTPEEAFFVKCDSETNPPEVVAAGQVVTAVGLALSAPAEFIVARIVHGTSGVTVQ
jgi:phage tail sheath protein FI